MTRILYDYLAGDPKRLSRVRRVLGSVGWTRGELDDAIDALVSDGVLRMVLHRGRWHIGRRA